MDPSSSGSNLLHGLTIHKQYLEYHELKSLMEHRLKLVNRWALLLNFLGVASLIYIIVTLFVDANIVPLSCILSHIIVWRGSDLNISAVYEPWTYVLAKLFGFMASIIMLVLGTYIIYYKAMVRVDSMRLIKGKTFCTMIIFGMIGLAHAVLSIFCAIKISYEEETSDGKTVMVEDGRK